MHAIMHPRNIYKDPPNFKELAETFPEFRKYVRLDLSGKLKFNFHDPEALAVLCKTLLLKDFNLNVEIPINKLVPTMPLRLNYVLWIEDLLKATDTSQTVSGIDIGTGASAIYSLLCAKKGWKMLATELDKTSYEMAKKNVEDNKLNNLIRVKLVENNDLMLEGVVENDNSYQFCMCNPPFFDMTEVPERRTNKRSPPNNAPTGSPIELQTEGGEIAFVTKIIDDSSRLKNQVMIYSSMVGKISNMNILKRKLLEYEPMSFTTTEFHQGRTTRWGLAWSYCVQLPDANKCKSPKQKGKKDKTKQLPITLVVAFNQDLDKAIEHIKIFFSELKLEVKETKKIPFTCHVAARENTWSNQRRKRREMMRNGAQEEVPPPAKKLKQEEEKVEETVIILEFIFQAEPSGGNIVLQGTWTNGSVGKDGVHQILQYLKNCFSKISAPS